MTLVHVAAVRSTKSAAAEMNNKSTESLVLVSKGFFCLVIVDFQDISVIESADEKSAVIC